MKAINIKTLERQLNNVNDVLNNWPTADTPYLKLDLWVSDCGTYRCLFGDFLFRRGGLDLLRRFARIANGCVTGHAISRHITQAFGPLCGLPERHRYFFSGNDGWILVFGGTITAGSLEQRQDYLVKHRDWIASQINEAHNSAS